MPGAGTAWKIWVLCSVLIGSALLIGCENPVSSESEEDKAALLLEHTINEQSWNRKGYQGLLQIQSELGMEVSYHENISTLPKLKEQVNHLEEKGVDLVFGHGKVFGERFMNIRKSYPDIHFVSINGETGAENMTSVQLKGYAMGYFAGRLAGNMTNTGAIAVIAARSWQPEVNGFADGAKSGDTPVEVISKTTGSWNNKEKALQKLQAATSEDADIVYPAGNGFHVDVINQAKEQGLQAIGYLGDQSDLGEAAVLTSTIQHVERVYQKIAEKYQKGELKSGVEAYGFEEGAVSLGPFSPKVPENVRQRIKADIDYYKETGELPGSQ
ncbi:BMP family ABC transporter substrate-binding protein [Salibacterium halotolerans]|uniref:Transcriptional activator of comK protein n=1 Tax=Salibacterium halotolerans TaxID=1884432 RepID=A0A1I5T819_9BACI|nr:BMP family ABC transporter substrate-binding protein [Salibacterium halotolerans]SFP79189.1 transcriptional activator of comK gene [Salibacterium halotolerans]